MSPRREALFTGRPGPGQRRARLGAGPEPRGSGPLGPVSMARTHPLTRPRPPGGPHLTTGRCRGTDNRADAGLPCLLPVLPGFLAFLALRELDRYPKGGDAPLAWLRRRACGDRARPLCAVVALECRVERSKLSIGISGISRDRPTNRRGKPYKGPEHVGEAAGGAKLCNPWAARSRHPW